MEIVNVPYNFIKEITSLVKITSTRISDKSIDFVINLAEDIPYELIGDKTRVKSIVNNLLTNAIKYTEQGKIEFTVKCINKENICNLIIIDEVYDGIECLDKIKAGFREKYMNLGFADYLSKPFSRNDIRKKLNLIFTYNEETEIEDKIKDAPTYIFGADSIEDIYIIGD